MTNRTAEGTLSLHRASREAGDDPSLDDQHADDQRHRDHDRGGHPLGERQLEYWVSSTTPKMTSAHVAMTKRIIASFISERLACEALHRAERREANSSCPGKPNGQHNLLYFSHKEHKDQTPVSGNTDSTSADTILLKGCNRYNSSTQRTSRKANTVARNPTKFGNLGMRRKRLVSR